MKRVMLVMAVALMSALQVSAQNGRNSESHPSSLGNGRVVTDKDKVNGTSRSSTSWTRS